MNTGIRRSASRYLLAGVTLTLAVAFSWLAVRQFTATMLAKSLDRSALVEASRLAPLNAEYHTRLGYYYLYVDQDAPRAEQQFREAIELAPTSPNGWLGIAKTELTNGNTSASVNALDQAIALDTKGTATIWEAGNLYIVMGETKKGLNQFKMAANTDPSLNFSVMEMGWRATRNVDLVLDEGLPATVEWRQSFLEFLASRERPDVAMHAWDRLVELKQPVELNKTFNFINYLIGQRRPNDAYNVWQGLISLSPKNFSSKDAGYITNGGFESPVLNGGFDWRWTETNEVSIGFDSGEQHSGTRSLALEIKPARLSTLPLYQYVKLEPNTRYRFRAFVKGHLASACGVRFAIAPLGKLPIAQTDEINDEGKWTEVSTVFTTHSDASIGTVTLIRERGETLVRGNLWIDDVSLVKEQSE